MVAGSATSPTGEPPIEAQPVSKYPASSKPPQRLDISVSLETVPGRRFSGAGRARQIARIGALRGGGVSG